MNVTIEELKNHYKSVGTFWSHDRVWVIDETGWFHVGRDGNPAYSERFECVGAFRNGKAKALKNGEWFFIRPNGTRIADNLTLPPNL